MVHAEGKKKKRKKILTESNVKGKYNLWDGFPFNLIITSSLRGGFNYCYFNR